MPPPALASDSSRYPLLALIIFLALELLITLVMLSVPELGAYGAVVDFDAFYIASQMVHEGRLTDAYNSVIMSGRQSHLAGEGGYMPWTYPPQFDLVIAPLSLLPRGIAYGIFMFGSLIAYALVLRRLAGANISMVLVGILPGIGIGTLNGQNGLLIAALIGLFCLLWLHGRYSGRAGLVLGLLVLKPHLAIGVGFAALFKRQWGMLALAVMVVVVSGLVATLVFGPEVWPAFLAATRQAGADMAMGLYPLFRMTSLYSTLFTLGVEAKWAFAIQFILALCALSSIGVAVWMRWPLRRILGVATLASLAISPYSYDYDMPVMGIALALLAQELWTCGRLGERFLLWIALWLCSGWGIFVIITVGRERAGEFPALGSVGFIMTFILIWKILLRCPPSVPATRN